MQTFPLHVDKSPKTSAKIAQLVEHDLAKVGVAVRVPFFALSYASIMLTKVRVVELVDTLL